MLYSGAYWDPATNYDAAVSASNRLPNSRLLPTSAASRTATTLRADGSKRLPPVADRLPVSVLNGTR